MTESSTSIASAWANILPSVYVDCYGNMHRAPELMGFTILEAMACGTPAISSRVAAMPEFIRDGETGFVFDEPDELAEQLRRLAADPELVETDGTAGPARRRAGVRLPGRRRPVGRRLRTLDRPAWEVAA